MLLVLKVMLYVVMKVMMFWVLDSYASCSVPGGGCKPIAELDGESSTTLPMGWRWRRTDTTWDGFPDSERTRSGIAFFDDAIDTALQEVEVSHAGFFTAAPPMAALATTQWRDWA